METSLKAERKRAVRVCMPTHNFTNTELGWWGQGIDVFSYTSELTPKWERRVPFAVPEDMGDFVNTLVSPSPKHRLKNPLREQSKDKSIENELQKVCSDWLVWGFQSNEDCRVSLFRCLVGLLCSCIHAVSNIQFLVWQQKCKPSWGGDKKK